MQRFQGELRLREKCRDKRKAVYLRSIFDYVKHGELLSILERRGLDLQDLKIIQYLYEHQLAIIKLEDPNQIWYK